MNPRERQALNTALTIWVLAVLAVGICWRMRHRTTVRTVLAQFQLERDDQ